jgi:hypothetical protein
MFDNSLKLEISLDYLVNSINKTTDRLQHCYFYFKKKNTRSLIEKEKKTREEQNQTNTQ